jgi:hypothetical protein
MQRVAAQHIRPPKKDGCPPARAGGRVASSLSPPSVTISSGGCDIRLLGGLRLMHRRQHRAEQSVFWQTLPARLAVGIVAATAAPVRLGPGSVMVLFSVLSGLPGL